jgi:hypothetical protein
MVTEGCRVPGTPNEGPSRLRVGKAQHSAVQTAENLRHVYQLQCIAQHLVPLGRLRLPLMSPSFDENRWLVTDPVNLDPRVIRQQDALRNEGYAKHLRESIEHHGFGLPQHTAIACRHIGERLLHDRR